MQPDRLVHPMPGDGSGTGTGAPGNGGNGSGRAERPARPATPYTAASLAAPGATSSHAGSRSAAGAGGGGFGEGAPHRYRFIGLPVSAREVGPFALLGLEPADATPSRVERALQAQLSRIDAHPESRSRDADLLRTELHRAAAMLRDPERRRQLIAEVEAARREAASPPPAMSTAPAPATPASAGTAAMRPLRPETPSGGGGRAGRPDGPPFVLNAALASPAGPPPVDRRPAHPGETQRSRLDAAAAPASDVLPSNGEGDAQSARSPSWAEGGQAVSGWAPAPRPAAARPRPVSRPPVPQFDPLVTDVAAALIAAGGWNNRSRRLLAAVSVNRAVEPAAMLEAVHEVATHADLVAPAVAYAVQGGMLAEAELFSGSPMASAAASPPALGAYSTAGAVAVATESAPLPTAARFVASEPINWSIVKSAHETAADGDRSAGASAGSTMRVVGGTGFADEIMAREREAQAAREAARSQRAASRTFAVVAATFFIGAVLVMALFIYVGRELSRTTSRTASGPTDPNALSVSLDPVPIDDAGADGSSATAAAGRSGAIKTFDPRMLTLSSAIRAMRERLDSNPGLPPDILNLYGQVIRTARTAWPRLDDASRTMALELAVSSVYRKATTPEDAERLFDVIAPPPPVGPPRYNAPPEEAIFAPAWSLAVLAVLNLESEALPAPARRELDNRLRHITPGRRPVGRLTFDAAVAWALEMQSQELSWVLGDPEVRQAETAAANGGPSGSRAGSAAASGAGSSSSNAASSDLTRLAGPSRDALTLWQSWTDAVLASTPDPARRKREPNMFAVEPDPGEAALDKLAGRTGRSAARPGATGTAAGAGSSAGAANPGLSLWDREDARERILLAGAYTILLEGPTLTDSPTARAALVAVLAPIDWARSTVARDRILAWFDDPKVQASDLHVLSGHLVAARALPGLDDGYIVPVDAGPERRSAAREALAAAWTVIDRDPRFAEMQGVIGDWVTQVQALLREVQPGSNAGAGAGNGQFSVGDTSDGGIDHDLILLARASRLNEVAAVIEAGRSEVAVDLLAGRVRPLVGVDGGDGSAGSGQPAGLPSFVPTATPQRGGSGNDGEWALDYYHLTQINDRDGRLEHFTQLLGQAKDGLGPIDATVLVQVALAGVPHEVRVRAMETLRDHFSDDPNTMLILADSIKPTREDRLLSRVIEQITGASLPEPRVEGWYGAARSALLAHVVAHRNPVLPNQHRNAFARELTLAYLVRAGELDPLTTAVFVGGGALPPPRLPAPGGGQQPTAPSSSPSGPGFQSPDGPRQTSQRLSLPASSASMALAKATGSIHPALPTMPPIALAQAAPAGQQSGAPTALQAAAASDANANANSATVRMIMGADAAEAVRRTYLAWLALARPVLTMTPTPAPLPDLEHRMETRLALQRGPVGQFAAWQVSVLELAAYVTAAERPTSRGDLLHIVNQATRDRLDAGSTPAQLLATELAILRVRAIRLGAGDSVDGARAAPALASALVREPVTDALRPPRTPESPAPDRPTSGAVPASVAGRGSIGASGPAAGGAVALGVMAAAHAQDGGGAVFGGFDDDDDGSMAFADRLARLRPADPEAYFVLAEDLAEAGEVALATRLFVIAADLDPQRFGRSSSLALAALAAGAGDSERARQLRGIAGMFPLPSFAGPFPGTSARPGHHLAGGAAGGSSGGAPGNGGDDDDDARFTAATMVSAMLGFYRLGEGAMALKAIELNSNTQAILDQYTRQVSSSADILNWCRANDDCDECHGRRIIQCPDCRGRPGDRRCPTCDSKLHVICTRCGGTPGPGLAAADIDRMLQFELMLLKPDEATWTDQFAFDGGSPMVVLDPAALADLYDVDARASLYDPRTKTWRRP